jgi:sulfur-oxidizing protein SoxX
VPYVKLVLAALLAAGIPCAAFGAVTDAALPPYTVVRDTIPQPLTAQTGDVAAGKAVIEDRKLGNCLSCHAMALPDADQGNVGPDLHAVGSRLSPAQLRLRLVNMKVVDPQTIMPGYYRDDVLDLLRGKDRFARERFRDAGEAVDAVVAGHDRLGIDDFHVDQPQA